jgi:hypothetical protein
MNPELTDIRSVVHRRRVSRGLREADLTRSRYQWAVAWPEAVDYDLFVAQQYNLAQQHKEAFRNQRRIV